MDQVGFSVAGFIFGGLGWFAVRYVLGGFVTVDQNQRAVKTSFGRAQRLNSTTLDNPMSESLRPDERERYKYPQVRVLPPGFYFKWPWEKVFKVSVAVETVNMAYDPEDKNTNRGGTMLDAVTKDQLNTGLVGQLRFRVAEQNLYAYLFAVKRPIVHIMGYFVSVLRQRIANFEAPEGQPLLGSGGTADTNNLAAVAGVSINDLRKNLRMINEGMDLDCASSAARYGIVLDASLITGIDPPPEVESALAAINTAHNQVSADISLAQASADQKAGAEPPRGRNRNPQRPGRSRATGAAGRAAHLAQEDGAGRAARLHQKRAAGAVRQGQPGDRRGRPMSFLITAFVTFVAAFIGVPLGLGLLRALGVYTTVEERKAKVYVLFGKVKGVLDEPGLHFLWPQLGPSALIINLFGKCHVVDLRLDQQYLRSQPVNSEEGAPMGIGIWYEMKVSDPISFLFKNADPKGSLRANVSNAAVRCLSNMRLADMLETRHAMSQAVRAEVTPKSHEWGYQLGSVYIRKVHFRDAQMIHQIEEKVVNRLRQVTSAIRQDGSNQVNIIKSTADRQAAIEFARAAAQRPLIVGRALQKISDDPEVMQAMYALLEYQKIINSDAKVTLLPSGSKSGELLAPLLAARVPVPVR